MSRKTCALLGCAMFSFISYPACAVGDASSNSGGANFSVPSVLLATIKPPGKIAAARVVDANGISIGMVRKVEVDTSGKPSLVDISPIGSKNIVVLDSSSLRYYETNNVLIANRDKIQFDQLPQTPSY